MNSRISEVKARRMKVFNVGIITEVGKHQERAKRETRGTSGWKRQIKGYNHARLQRGAFCIRNAIPTLVSLSPPFATLHAQSLPIGSNELASPAPHLTLNLPVPKEGQSHQTELPLTPLEVVSLCQYLFKGYYGARWYVLFIFLSRMSSSS